VTYRALFQSKFSINPRKPGGQVPLNSTAKKVHLKQLFGLRIIEVNQLGEITLSATARHSVAGSRRTNTMKHTFFIPALATGMLLSASTAWSADHQVLMLNKDSEGRPMQFEPAFLRIEPGDSVTFVPTDKGHNSESINDLIANEDNGWKGKINEEITVTFDEEGFYAYKCLPHFGLGMVGLVQVGSEAQPLDPALVEKLPGRAKDRMAELVAETAAVGE
jgi:pseudoazurin